jgi:hypothetical protein
MVPEPPGLGVLGMRYALQATKFQRWAYEKQGHIIMLLAAVGIC